MRATNDARECGSDSCLRRGGASVARTLLSTTSADYTRDQPTFPPLRAIARTQVPSLRGLSAYTRRGTGRSFVSRRCSLRLSQLEAIRARTVGTNGSRNMLRPSDAVQSTYHLYYPPSQLNDPLDRRFVLRVQLFELQELCLRQERGERIIQRVLQAYGELTSSE